MGTTALMGSRKALPNRLRKLEAVMLKRLLTNPVWRWLLGLFMTLLLLVLAACSGGAPGCNPVTFGNSTCTSGSGGSGSFGGGSGGGGGGGGNSSPTAFAFAVDEDGTMDSYTFSKSAGTLGPTPSYTSPTFVTNLGSEGAVVAQGKYLYVVLQAQQEIWGFTIGADGSLTTISGFPMTVPISGIGQVSYNQQVVMTNPAGTLLFVSEAGSETILVYQIGSGGALTPGGNSPFSTLSAGIEPENLAMDGNGKFLYVSEESADHNGAFLTGYTVGANGTLTLMNPTFQFEFPIWEMQGDPSGKYLIGITGDTQYYVGTDLKEIYVFNIDSSTGALTNVSGSPFATTYAPFNMAVQPISSSSELIYTFGINDQNTGTNPVEGFTLNTSNGQVAELSNSPFSGLTSTVWGQFDQSGQYIFTYLGTAPNPTLGVLAVAADGTLTEPTSTTPLTTSGYFAVADVP